MSYYCPWGQLSNIELKTIFFTFVHFLPLVWRRVYFYQFMSLAPWKNPVYAPAHSYFREPGVDAGFFGGGGEKFHGRKKHSDTPLKNDSKGQGAVAF